MPEQKKLRRQGITRMAEVYAGADKVLILDNTLQYEDSNISLIKMSVRIRFSAWASRLWTLLEGRLSKDLYVQFKDKAVDIAPLVDSVKVCNSISNAFDEIMRRVVLGRERERERERDHV